MEKLTVEFFIRYWLHCNRNNNCDKLQTFCTQLLLLPTFFVLDKKLYRTTSVFCHVLLLDDFFSFVILSKLWFACFIVNRDSTRCHYWMVSLTSGWTVDLEPQRSEHGNNTMMAICTASAFGNLAYSNGLFSGFKHSLH